MSFCIMVNYAKDNIDKATIGFTLANAGLESGERVSIILASEGVLLATKGYADDINNGEPFKPLKELILSVLKQGGSISACIPCMKKRGLEENQVLSDINLIGGPDVIRIMNECEKSIQL